MGSVQHATQISMSSLAVRDMSMCLCNRLYVTVPYKQLQIVKCPT